MTDLANVVLVHVSDLHFADGKPALEERYSHIRLRLNTDLLTLLDELETKADALLVTGDIAYAGKRAEYERAYEWFNQIANPIMDGPTRILCVPGNHDVDWDRVGPTHEGHRLMIQNTSDGDLDALLDGYLNEEGQAILFPLEAYNEFASSLDCGLTDRFSWEAPLSIGAGYELSFRGVTTPVNSHQDDAPGSLAVHSNQLLFNPAPGQIPVLLAHHDAHFWRCQHQLHSDIANRVSLALFGHTHQPRLQKVEECVELTGGAVQPEEGDDSPAPTYNVLRLAVANQPTEGATLRVEAWRRTFSPDADAFIPATAGGTFDSRVVLIGSPAMAPSPDTDSPATREKDRPALTTATGTPQPRRKVQHGLYGMGAGRRISVLAALGLPVDHLATLPPHLLISRAADAIVEADKVEEFQKHAANAGDTDD